MTYGRFLALFVALPTLTLVGLLVRGRRCGSRPERGLWAVGLHSLIALVCTAPWDNYLVKNRVWWYDPGRVSGLTLGWVPIEEYAFFVLQPFLTGSWLLWLEGKLADRGAPVPRLEWRPVRALALLPGWAAAAVLAARSRRARYLALILLWALPPLGLQLAAGGWVLRRQWRWLAAGILVPSAYLAAADTVAIRAGIWTISPEQSLGRTLPGGLPVEEALFFLITNSLVGFGVALVLTQINGREQEALQ